ncbi:MAG: DUF167 domain-containing protein [Chlamydiales bacterium]|nr:DUF167 domain-containing protein [Chlamydiales bacterium]
MAFEIHIKVIPKSSKNEIVGWENNELKIRLRGVPEKGKANELLIEFLAKTLQIAKSQITLISGATNRHKRLMLHNIEKETFLNLMKQEKKL